MTAIVTRCSCSAHSCAVPNPDLILVSSHEHQLCSCSTFQSSAPFLSNITATPLPAEDGPITAVITIWPSSSGASTPTSQPSETHEEPTLSSSSMPSSAGAISSTSISVSSVILPPPSPSTSSNASDPGTDIRQSAQPISGSIQITSIALSDTTSSEESTVSTTSLGQSDRISITIYTVTVSTSISAGTTIVTSPTNASTTSSSTSSSTSSPTSSSTSSAASLTTSSATSLTTSSIAIPPTTPPTGFATRTTPTTTASTTLTVGVLPGRHQIQE
ncbi:hypothetical protein GGR53DRAFT_513216 [Hypoxylon sp. FL1150]|nr:hypothetical protein GGR53DRAFT_513216 [Hypoxylon sp. FL1150]